MDLTARWLRPLPVVSVAAVGPYAETVQEAWEHLRGLLIKHGARQDCRPGFALLRDLPQEARAENRRLEMCAQISEDWRIRLSNEAATSTFGGGAYLVTRHQGSYQALPEVFSRMYAACSLDMNISLDTKRPRNLFFHGDPDVTPPEELIAELGLPVVAQSPERPRGNP